MSVSLHPFPDATESRIEQEVGVVSMAEAWCAELAVGCWTVTVGMYCVGSCMPYIKSMLSPQCRSHPANPTFQMQ